MKLRKLIIRVNYALVPLTCNQLAIIDLCDVEKVGQYNWYAVWDKETQTFRAKAWINGKSLYMHRFILNIVNSNIYIDHHDSNGLNNRQYNIRYCTNSQNQMNKRPQKGYSSQYKGVSWHKRDKKWSSYIKLNGKNVRLGFYNDEKIAAIAYNEIAHVLFGEFAKLNKI